MIFYKVTRPTGTSFLLTREIDAKSNAKAIDGTYEQIDIPVDKQGLMSFVNDLYSKMAGLQQDLADPANVASTIPIVVQEKLVIPADSDIPETHEDWFEKATLQFNAKLLDAQIEKLGEKGMPALELLESHQELTGVGGHFARGVILLCVLASGEHQLARLFHRKKIK